MVFKKGDKPMKPFQKGHKPYYSFKGRKHTEEAKEKFRLAKLGDKNPMWKGDNVGLSPLHRWVLKRLPKPEFCDICHKEPPYDLANKGVYNRELNNWLWSCRRCHMLSDGRFNNLKQYCGNYQEDKIK